MQHLYDKKLIKVKHKKYYLIKIYNILYNDKEINHNPNYFAYLIYKQYFLCMITSSTIISFFNYKNL